MKFVMQLLSLILCLELIIPPIQGNLILPQSSLAEDPTCPAGQTYNSAVNRCLTSSQVLSVNNAVNSCRSITDEAAKRACYDENAQSALSGQNPDERSNKFINANGGTTTLGGITSAATIAVPLLFLTKALIDRKKRGSPCKPASLMLLYAGGAALGVGEIVTFIQHKNKLSELDEARKAWKTNEDASNADDNKVIATNAQSEAFELLAMNEDSIAQVAKNKTITYGIAAGLFAAGAIMGTIEAVNLKRAYATNDAATITRLTCGADKKGIEDANKNSSTGGSAGGSASGSAGGSAGGSASGSAGGSAGSNGSGNRINANTFVGAASTIVPAVIGGGGSGSSASGTSTSTTTTTGSTQTGSPPSCPSGQIWSASQNQCIQDAETCTFSDEFDCKSNGCTWHSKDEYCSAYQNINEILNKGIKTKAVQNIQHARSYAEMMELMAEINSLEFENYSRNSYYNESPLIDSFDNKSFSSLIPQIVSNFWFAEAQAEGKPVNNFTMKDIMKAVNDNKGKSDNLKSAAHNQVEGIMNKAVYLPTGRAITNGLLGGWMTIMTFHMNKQRKISEDRAEILRRMKDEFNTGGGIGQCTSSDRNDPGKPACYCFTSDDKVNPARTKSKVCSNKLATLNNPANLANGTPKVCVDENFGIDQACSCRNRKKPDGKNSCAKVGSNLNIPGLNPGTFKMINAAAGPANDLFNGNASAGSFNPASIGANAARIKKIADDSLKKDKGSAKMMKSLENSLLASTNGMTMGGPGFSQGSPLSGMNPQQAAAALDKEIKNEESDVQTAGPGTVVTPGGNSTEPQPEFGMTEDQLAAQETEVAEVMKENLDMGNNDINNSSSTNLFDVLSNRYQRSGMRRLFDEKGETKADKPAETDIAP
jgi:hypothetical protein